MKKQLRQMHKHGMRFMHQKLSDKLQTMNFKTFLVISLIAIAALLYQVKTNLSHIKNGSKSAWHTIELCLAVFAIGLFFSALIHRHTINNQLQTAHPM